MRVSLRRVGLVAVCFLVGGEAVVRVVETFGKAPTASLYSLIVPGKPRFTLRPSADIIVPERYGNIEYRLNSHGFRDREHSLSGTTQRIVLLGDSVTFGLGVRQDQTFAALLARALENESGGRREVVNLAVFAYDTRDELATYRTEGAPFGPAVVVLQFFLNDFAIEDHAAAPTAPTLTQRLVATRNLVLNQSALYRRLQQWSLGAVYYALHDIRRTRWPDSLNASEPRSKLAYLAEHPRDEDVAAFAAIADLQQLVERGRSRLLVMISPDETQLYRSDWDAIQARLARFCDARGIRVLDLLPILRADPRRTQIFLDGVHYSAFGHARVASALQPAVVDLLPSATEPD